MKYLNENSQNFKVSEIIEYVDKQ